MAGPWERGQALARTHPTTSRLASAASRVREGDVVHRAGKASLEEASPAGPQSRPSTTPSGFMADVCRANHAS
jgi:hypothetical protein